MDNYKELDGRTAWEIDSAWAKENNSEPVYAEFDEDDEIYYVFGIETGFAYASYFDEDEAEEEAGNLNKRLNKD